MTEIKGSLPQHTTARVILRNITGKYCWDSTLFFESIKPKGSNTTDQSKRNLGMINSFAFKPETANVENIAPLKTDKYQRKKGEIPLWKPDSGCEDVGMLDQLLQ